MRSHFWLALAVGLASSSAGVLCGRASVAASKTPARAVLAEPQARECPPAPPPLVVAPSPSANVGELRQALREELSRELDARDQQRDAGRSEDDVAETAEHAALLTQAVDLAQAARAARHWRVADRDRLRALARGLTPAERMEIARTLNPAINSGELSVDFAGSIF